MSGALCSGRIGTSHFYEDYIYPLTSVQTSGQTTDPKMGPKKDKSKESFRNKNGKCVYYNRGYCKHGTSCRDIHPDKVCQDPNCFEQDCQLRHPNPCRFGPRCYFNRKNICVYAHNDNSEKKIKDLEKRVQILEKEKEALNVTLEKKFETFENKIRMLKDSLDDKEKTISAFETRLIEKENSVDEKLKEIESNWKIKEKSIFKCEECNFTTSSEQGLKTHTKRKHIKTSKQPKNYPTNCEFCDIEVKSKLEMKLHLKTHSYKPVNYECAECDFLGTTEPTMDVHNGKQHSENIECGLCDSVFKDHESLELHLCTCEIYKCEKCNNIFRNLTDLKTHVEKVHAGNSSIQIEHSKQNRQNKEEFDSYFYTYQKLFSTKKDLN